MASRDDNELLTRVGPGTPMGTLMRQYWIPGLLSSELEPGGRTKRVRLLGEDLVAFRTRDGRAGLLAEHCSHRGASLYFGRNEESGLRCVYHGWKYALDGLCVDTPNEPREGSLKNRVRHRAYPCAERGGVIWTYMGQAEPPRLPDFEWTILPDGHRFVSKFYEACNYLQALEGGIDSSHIAFLHAPLDPQDGALLEDLQKGGFGIAEALKTADTAPHFEVVDTDYGAVIGARRRAEGGQYYWRITQFLMPFCTMPPPDTADPVYNSHLYVPVDDEHLVNWCITWHASRALAEKDLAPLRAGKGTHVLDYLPPTSEPYGDIRPAAGMPNDYLMDWEAHRNRRFCGVPGFGGQDQAACESQGPIFDRSQERLGASDTAIVRVRHLLLRAARGLQTGSLAPGLDAPLAHVRPRAVTLPERAVWSDWVTKQGPTRVGNGEAANAWANRG